jgi:homoserine trans-succinylase
MPKKKKQEEKSVQILSNKNLLDNIDIVKLQDELYKVGLNEESIAKMLLELCSAEQTKMDKAGNIISGPDNAVRLNSIRLWAEIMGYTAKGKKIENKELHLHKHVGEMDDRELQELVKSSITG